MRNQNYGAHWAVSRYIPLFLFSLLLLVNSTTWAQKDSPDNTISLLPRTLDHLQNKAGKLSNSIEQNSERRLRKLQKLEQKLLSTIPDSLRRTLDLPKMPAYGEVLQSLKVANVFNSFYSGRLDSLTTSLKLLGSISSIQLPNTANLTSSLEKLKGLHTNLSGSEQLTTLLQGRLQQLQSTLSAAGLGHKLARYQKEVYYYRAKLKEYKRLVEAPDRWAGFLLTQAQRLPQFQTFFARNSQLGQLFALPGAAPDGISATLTAGLQTRAAVEQGFRDRFGNSADLNASLQQNIPARGSNLDELRGRAEGLTKGTLGGGGEQEMPAGFKPNVQKTKSFWKRLEWGSNFQSQRARNFFPVTSDIGLSLGFKLNNRSVVGVGTSYKLGWGRGWDHIALSHQGVGVRSFVDVQLKGSIYISGGYEQNYRTAFNTIAALKNYSAWQSSGLIGLTKKYKAGKLKGNMQLLWDLLSYKQVPQTQAIIWRVGYSVNK